MNSSAGLTREMPSKLLLLLSLTLVLHACTDGTGDDDNEDPPADDDDDWTPPEPVPLEPGSFEGTSNGVVILAGNNSYLCDGEASIEVVEPEEDGSPLLSSGQVDCHFVTLDMTCALTVDAVEVDASPQAMELDCYQATSGLVQSWWDQAQTLSGRYQALGDSVSVEITWATLSTL